MSCSAVVQLTSSGDEPRIRGTNATDASVPARTPTLTEPSGLGDSAAQATASGVIDLRNGGAAGSPVQNRARITPYGAGSDTNTFTMRVIGWSRVTFRAGDATTEPKYLWVPRTLAEFTCTLSTPVGVAGGAAINTDRFCDTIVRTIGADTSSEVISPANDTVAHVTVDLKGCAKLEITFGTGSSATSCNAAVGQY